MGEKREGRRGRRRGGRGGEEGWKEKREGEKRKWKWRRGIGGEEEIRAGDSTIVMDGWVEREREGETGVERKTREYNIGERSNVPWNSKEDSWPNLSKCVDQSALEDQKAPTSSNAKQGKGGAQKVP